jgi:hypothetical protein
LPAGKTPASNPAYMSAFLGLTGQAAEKLAFQKRFEIIQSDYNRNFGVAPNEF